MAVLVPSVQEEIAQKRKAEKQAYLDKLDEARFLKERFCGRQKKLESEFPTQISRCEHGVYAPLASACGCSVCKSSPDARCECRHRRTSAHKIQSVAPGISGNRRNGKRIEHKAPPDLDSDVVTREEGVAAEWAWRRRVKNPHFVRGRKLPNRLQWAYSNYNLRALVSRYAIRESDIGRHLLIVYWYLRCGFSARNIAEERHCTEQQIQSQLQRLIARAESVFGKQTSDGPRAVYDEAGKKIGYAHDPLGRTTQTPEDEVGSEPAMYACTSLRKGHIGIGSPDDAKFDRWQFEGNHKPEGLGVAEVLHPGLIAEAAEYGELAENPITSAL